MIYFYYMAGAAKKILIAEDERPLARALSLKLTSAGFAVDVAYEGATVHEKVMNEKYSLILMDLMMPKHDGFALMEEAKKNGIKTPIVVISNLGQESDVERAMEAGAKEYFVKSETPLSTIVDFVKKHTA